MLTFVVSSLIFLLAGCVQGLTGFGGGLVAVPLLCLILPVQVAIPLSVLCCLGITCSLAYALRRSLAWRNVLPLLLGSLPGIYAGTLLLECATHHTITTLLGVLLLVISLVNLTVRLRPVQLAPFWAYLFGFFSGCLSGSVATGGPPVIIYTLLTDWKKNEIKATLSVFFIVSGLVTAGMHTVAGLVTPQVLRLVAPTLVSVLVGTWIGATISDRINRQTYVRLVYMLLLALGVLLLSR